MQQASTPEATEVNATAMPTEFWKQRATQWELAAFNTRETHHYLIDETMHKLEEQWGVLQAPRRK